MRRSAGTNLGASWIGLVCLIAGCATEAGDGTPQDATSSVDTSSNAAEDTGGDTSPNPTEDTSSTPTEDASPAQDTSATVDAGASQDTGTADTGPPPPPTDPCEPGATPSTKSIVIPLGETLHFSGDDYLAFWSGAMDCAVALETWPDGAQAVIQVGANEAERLTPDVAGIWTLSRGSDVLTVEVDDAYLTPDTFVNYNYSPVTPIAQTADGALWVASAVSASVHRVVITDGVPVPDVLVPTGSWPTALAVWVAPDGMEWLLVSQTGRDSLGWLDPASGRLVDALWVGNEPAGLLVDGDVAYVALSGEDRVARVDLVQRAITDVVDVSRDPRAMALDAANGRLFVASLISGNAHPRGPVQGEPLSPSEQRDVAVIDLETWTVSGWIHEVGNILRGLWLSEDATELLVAASHAHNLAAEVDADTQPHTHTLVRVDVDPDSDTPLSVVGEVDLDGQPTSMGPAPSPFTMATTPDGAHLIVTLAAGQAVLILDAETREETERLPAGSDPRGLVFAEDRFWTYAWLDNQLVGWPMPGMAGDMVQATVGDDPTPLEIKQGQRMFNDASFSKHSDFSCNNCHIDGLTDGLVWDILTDGPVNTIAFRNVGGSSPFLWGGQLPTLFDFSREVLKLVGASASGAQMQLLTTYMQSVTAPPNPFTLPGGRLTPAAEAGKALFEGKADCGGCHSGTLLTNQALVSGKTDGLMTDVPSLFGAYDTGPWGREGQWTTLDGMVEYAVEFTAATLTDDELDALKAYVREQPADRLYLTSAKPLNHSHHIWYETPIELTFSAVLSAGQEGLFTFHQGDPTTDELVPVPGSWEVSGRMARFTPTAPLSLQTPYVSHVQAPLLGSLGQATSEALTVTFETGGLPELDVSGNWDLTLCESTIGCLDLTVALLQSDGGQVTGVPLDNFEEGELDHLEGVMDGTVLALDPFTIQSIIGPILVENGVALEMWDNNDDGFADAGDGEVPFDFGGGTYLVEFYANRLSLPGE